MLTWPEFNQQFNEFFDELINLKIKEYQTLIKDKQVRKYTEYLADFTKGGKRVRPYCAYLAFSDSGKKLTEDVLYVLSAIELIHVMGLIHDDICDRSSMRRGLDTVHKHVEVFLVDQGRKKDAAHIGISQAILLGDLMFSLACECMARVPQSSSLRKNHAESQAIFYRLINQVALGQMLDTDMTTRSPQTKATILEKTKLKSAWYTFAHPMQIGAVFSGNKEIESGIVEIGLEIGMAFQIQDDVLDVSLNSELNKSPFKDVTERQQTILSQVVFGEGSLADQKLLKNLQGNKISKAKQKDLDRVFTESGAKETAVKMYKKHFAKARLLNQKSRIKETTKQSIEAMIRLLEKRNS